MRALGVMILVSLCVIVCGHPAQIANNNGRPAEEQANRKSADGQQGEEYDSRTELRIERKPIPPPVVYQFSRTVGRGRLVKKEHGTPGEVVRTYEVFFKDGKPVSKKLINMDRIEPEPVLFLMGSSGYPSSRHEWVRGKVLTMSATAYDPSAGRGKRATFRTANGMKAGYGKVAVDPRVIPLGTMLYVEGYGFAIAADTGGAIKGMKIDLGMPTYREAMKFGRKKVVVHVLKEPS
jgi:3D (Asp-Asp-Asp) domain-containing protein